MIKKFVIGALFVSTSLMSVPASARGPDPICLLHAGCFYDIAAQEWVCADPAAYMLCLEP